MAYVVLDGCIRCKYTDCVAVCPVNCFHEGENMVVIHPDECIDCGVCEPECPVEAIVPESDPRASDWLGLNRSYSERWPRIAAKRPPPPDADDWRLVEDKKALFSPAPARTDRAESREQPYRAKE